MKLIKNEKLKNQGLYSCAHEHDSCGVGFVVNINGEKSHQIIQDGLTILKNLVHRGAIGGDAKTGDGCGILLQIPHLFYKKEAEKIGFSLPDIGQYGMGMFFLPSDITARKEVLSAVEEVIKLESGHILGSRYVPVNFTCLGEQALKTMPVPFQLFVSFDGLQHLPLERKLYVIRKRMEKEIQAAGFSIDDFYIPSFSAKTVNYKGMFVAPQLEAFYSDFQDSDFQSAFALIHQRYSTNTFPSWPMAQPFRFMAHNGEINTLRGNINKMTAREKTLASELFGHDMEKLFPIITEGGSDSAIFDNVFELLLLSGRSPEHVMMMMIPEAFGTRYHISEDKRAFFEYHTCLMEPWDGPAAMVFTDGEKVAASLDRNGLRPLRYVITTKGKVVMASEVGVLDIPLEEVQEKGRLAPGKMFLVDISSGRILRDNEIKALISRRQPYRRWLEENRIELRGLFQPPKPVEIEKQSLVTKQKTFGYTLEDLKMILAPMAEKAQEPVGSMGNDVPLAVLSERPQIFYHYFKQLFAQVTNPPIDPYRENLVMSLMSYIGREQNLLSETPQHCHQLKLNHPILSNDDVDKLRHAELKDFRSFTLPMLFELNESPGSLEKGISKLCQEAEKKVGEGYSILILSDRGIDASHVPIPALIAVSSVHHHLIRSGKRHLTGLVAETGEAREVMHFAMLIGYGASAINPYLAFETLADMKSMNALSGELSLEASIDNYIIAVKKGLLKIMSKMGISTIRSYKGAQIFEAVGLHTELVARYFPGTPSRIGGVDLTMIEKESLQRHAAAFKDIKTGKSLLDSGGDYHYRSEQEKHLYSPEIISLLQQAVRENDYSLYKRYAGLVNEDNRYLCTLRGLFTFKKGHPVPLDEVESVDSIIKRFVTSAMSFGSISKEAHEALAIAMNRLGAASNSGEGGEEEERYQILENGDSSMSAVKQVASGRFGVTSHYLVNSRELQIKMAQGAKPGEGGQLPGHKVDKTIARVRHSTPGVMLISPPPHHDIYSIEDLAQLIFDLKNANPEARISVKLVSEVGVGTIAAGVAKAKADMVLISGHDGGTGASPLSSIKHAGIPWEIGLAETQQTLVINSLRDRIRVQVDGKMMTGRDVVVAALLGAEEFGFGTTALITLGCVMMRKCHLNTCPVGVATQNPDLRKKFKGKPEYVIHFMEFIAQEVREFMAQLGFKKFDDMVGHAEYLDMKEGINQWKAKGLDFSSLFQKPDMTLEKPLRCIRKQKHELSGSLDASMIEESREALQNRIPVKFNRKIRNSNRTVGATLSSVISKSYGAKGLPPDTIHCRFTGSAGQSFGAFLAPGVTFELEGDANDYVGKGLSGGKLIIYPSKKSPFRPNNNIITGNVNLFGATSGELYLHGMAGERFAVRNSGAVAVVEGVGDHGCEYMTGGVVVVLGQTGINFAAGMSGGIAFVLDENQLFDTRCNLEMVNIEPLAYREDQNLLYKLIQNHVRYTGSEYAAGILHAWSEMILRFVKVMPLDYKNALERMKMEKSRDTEVVTMTEEVK
ncbi:MAG: glutamate synthase large subunit [Candidatus Aureabacteria bacterium]|nr:glutamate synthase large subunit [Candidatus Auribacterota bacterium]